MSGIRLTDGQPGPATQSALGLVIQATDAEVALGLNTGKYVTPAALKNAGATALGLGTAAFKNFADAFFNASDLQGRDIATTVPTDGQALVWNLANSRWQPGTVSTTVGTVTSVDASGGTTGLTFSGGPVTSSGTLTLAGTLAIANGGTGATDNSGARTNLGLAIGTNVQAYDAGLASIAGLTTSADQGIYATAADTYATFSLTSAGRALLDDADAAAQRTTLGLGTIATQASSSVSITGGSITGITDLAVADGGTGASTAADARVNLLPSYTGNGSKVLALNSGATDVEWTTSSGGGGTTYMVKTANYTMADLEGVLANTSAGVFTVTLPATPSVGSQCIIADDASTFGTNNLTVGRNGSTIEGSAADLVLDINGVSVQFIYNGTTWNVFAQIGGNGGTGVNIEVSTTAPVAPFDGDLWWDSTAGRLKIYYDDGNTAQWVDASPAGSGFNPLAPGPIGSTTPSTVAATTITASSTITPSQTAGIVGTTTNNNADAGSVGEYVESTVASASKVALTNIVQENVTSISLTAGDWDVWGNAYFDPAATTTFDLIISSISTVSATSPSRDTGNQAVLKVTNFGTGIPSALQPVPQRLSLSATTTVYLVVVCSFAVSTMHAFGTLRARRVR